MTRNITAVLLLLSMMLTLFACGKTQKDTHAGGSESIESETDAGLDTNGEIDNSYRVSDFADDIREIYMQQYNMDMEIEKAEKNGNPVLTVIYNNVPFSVIEILNNNPEVVKEFTASIEMDANVIASIGDNTSDGTVLLLMHTLIPAVAAINSTESADFTIADFFSYIRENNISKRESVIALVTYGSSRIEITGQTNGSIVSILLHCWLGHGNSGNSMKTSDNKSQNTNAAAETKKNDETTAVSDQSKNNGSDTKSENNKGNTSPSHTHSFVTHTGKPATCSERGYYDYKTCSCGYSDKVEIPALGHDYAFTESKEATCDSTGYYKYECVRCGDSYTDTIPATGHNYIEATCSSPKTCRNCGISVGNALPHDMYYTKCNNCDYTDFSSVAMYSNTFCLSSWWNNGGGSNYLDDGEASINIDSSGVCTISFASYQFTFTLKQSYLDYYGLHFDCYQNGQKVNNTELTFYSHDRPNNMNRCGFFSRSGALGFSQLVLEFSSPVSPF